MTKTSEPLFSRIAFAGIAIALIMSVTFWQSNMARVPYEDALPTIFCVIGLSAGVTALFRLFAGNWIRAGLMVGILSFYLLYVPTLVRLMTDAGWFRTGLLTLAGLIALDLARKIPRDRGPLLALNRRANLVLMSVAFAMCAVAGVKQVLLESARPDNAKVFSAFQGKATADSPDVWHIIFDRYASNDTLRTVYAFDNQAFLDALAARGFQVREGAYSNYQRTAFSVASTLNGAYLDPLADAMQAHQRDWVPLYRAMTDNAAMRFFKAQGYRTVFAGSWWNPTRRSLSADINVNYRAIPELGRLILEQSLLGTILEAASLPYGDGRADQCKRAHVKFDELRQITNRDERKYVFAHFLVPHPPFVLNADGSCRTLERATKSSRRDNYVGQVRFANDVVLKLIDRIEEGPRPAIIILHADEGPWPVPFVGDERFAGHDPVAVDWPKINDAQLREKMGILLAVKWPGGADAPQSPVNIYPMLLRDHFHGQQQLQADRNLLFVSDTALYTFADVTARLRQAP